MRDVAVIYLRESTKDQGRSKAAQHCQIVAVLNARNTTILGVYEESASARNEESGVRRPEFKKAIEHALREGAFIAVASMDRFTRTTTTFESYLARGGRVVAANLGFDRDDNVLRAAVARAELEGNWISHRTREGQRKARERGVKLGAPDIKTNAQPKGVEANVHKAHSRGERFKELEARAFSAGVTTAAGVANFLNEIAHPTPRGKQWTEENVRRLRRQLRRYGLPTETDSANWTDSQIENNRIEAILADLELVELDERLEEGILNASGRISERTLEKVKFHMEAKGLPSDHVGNFIARLRRQTPDAAMVDGLIAWLARKERDQAGQREPR